MRGHGARQRLTDFAGRAFARTSSCPPTRHTRPMGMRGDFAAPSKETQVRRNWHPTAPDGLRYPRYPNDLRRRRIVNEPMGLLLPAYFVLPMYQQAASSLPLRAESSAPSEETLMEIWSLKRYSEGERPGEAHALRPRRDVGDRTTPAFFVRMAADPGPRISRKPMPVSKKGPARQKGFKNMRPCRGQGWRPHLELPPHQSDGFHRPGFLPRRLLPRAGRRST